MLPTASFLKQLLQEKLLVFNPLPELTTRNLLTPYSSSIPHKKIFSICPAKDHAELFLFKLSPVVNSQTPFRSEKADYLKSAFSSSSHENRDKNTLGLRVAKVSGLLTQGYSRAEWSFLYILTSLTILHLFFDCPGTLLCLPTSCWGCRSIHLVANISKTGLTRHFSD